jgi:hypothetical protein
VFEPHLAQRRTTLPSASARHQLETYMRILIAGCGLLAGMLVVLAQAPSLHVHAQQKPAPARPKTPGHTAATLDSPEASRTIDPGKEADIRKLIDLTGAKSLGEQLMSAGMEQFRASVLDSQPDNPRAKQFVDAFVARFQKHFDPKSLSETEIPIYDKYLTAEDLKGLLAYYSSPLGQRMLKVLPEIAQESQAAGFSLGQKAAQQTMEDLKADFPEFVTGSKDEEKRPAAEPKNEN